jgi:hypothetical protein
MSEKRNYLHIAQPDHGTGATIDFASFRTTNGDQVEEVTVKVQLTYNSRTGKPELYVYATTGEHARIVIEETSRNRHHRRRRPARRGRDERRRGRLRIDHPQGIQQPEPPRER